MANRRSFGSGNIANFNQGNRGPGYNPGPGLAGVSPWQSGSSPGRSGLQGGNSAVPSLLATNNILNQLTTDPSIAIATKLLSSILPVQQSVQQPPSLMSLNNSYGSSVRYGGGAFGGDRFNRMGRRTDNFRNRRQANDRNKDRKGGDNKAKTKTKSKDEKDKTKKEDEDDNEDERKDDDEKGENQDDDGQKEGNERDEGPIPEYENIPTKLFHCHVCVKSMWNDVSFDTHVKGRNHRNKLRDLEESYQVQTDLMRQIAAMSLKLDELRRGGKRRPYPDQYCKMCDLHFNGMTMFAHRSTSEHQNLKRFIHPSCEMCKIDFQMRIEYDEHILTPQHLQQEAKAILRKEKLEKDPFYVKLREKEIKMASLFDEALDVKEKGDVELSEEDKNLIKILMSENETLPEYDPDAETLIAEHFVVPQSGYFCKACKLFLLSRDFVDIHCRTVSHYKNYIEVLKTEATKTQKAAEAEAEEAESENEKRQFLVSAKDLPPEAIKKSESNEDNSGNWKRRKVENKNSEVNGGKKYDPEETIDETMEDFTSDTSAGSKVKVETSETEAEKEDEKATKPTMMTTRRARGRAAKK